MAGACHADGDRYWRSHDNAVLIQTKIGLVLVGYSGWKFVSRWVNKSLGFFAERRGDVTRIVCMWPTCSLTAKLALYELPMAWYPLHGAHFGKSSACTDTDA